MRNRYKTYAQIKQRITAVYHTSLGCWVFMKHRKDGKVSLKQKPAYGFNAHFQKGVSLCRAGGYSFKPSASGWQRATTILKGDSEWKDVHEACYQNLTK